MQLNKLENSSRNDLYYTLKPINLLRYNFFFQMAHAQVIYPSRNPQTIQGLLIPLDCEELTSYT